MYNCWWTNKGANEHSFVFVHQHGGYDVKWKLPVGLKFETPLQSEPSMSMIVCVSFNSPINFQRFFWNGIRSMARFLGKPWLKHQWSINMRHLSVDLCWTKEKGKTKSTFFKSFDEACLLISLESHRSSRGRGVAPPPGPLARSAPAYTPLTTTFFRS